MAAVAFRPLPPEKNAFLHSIHQFHGAVMLNLQALRKASNGRFLICRQALHREQAHILLWFQAHGSRGLLTVVQVPPYQKTKLRQRLVLITSVSLVHRADYNIARRLGRTEKRTRLQKDDWPIKWPFRNQA